MNDLKFVALIPARYGSTRFPGKPLADIGGKTMTHRVYEQVKKAVETVYVATDDQRIYDEVVRFAADLGMVPLQLHKEQPGYILNSMLVPFLNAAEALYATGVADPETIDKTWMLGTGALTADALAITAAM